MNGRISGGDGATEVTVPMVEFRENAWWTVRHVKGTEVYLSWLAPNQCVTWGDGETYYRLLTRTAAKSEAEALALAATEPTP